MREPFRVGLLPTYDDIPVPWFVPWIDGVPDFRVTAETTAAAAINAGVCFICGRQRGRFSTFIVGPLAVINLSSAEPPAHRDCAQYALQVCPFMVNPAALRTSDAPLPAGVERHPEVLIAWTTKRWSLFATEGGLLIGIGDPSSLDWYTGGQPAGRDVCGEALKTARDVLLKVSPEAEEDDIHHAYERAVKLLPKGN